MADANDDRSVPKSGTTPRSTRRESSPAAAVDRPDRRPAARNVRFEAEISLLRLLSDIVPSSSAIETVANETAAIETATAGPAPRPVDQPLRFPGNMLLLPHVGQVVERNCRPLCGDTLENVEAFLDGRAFRPPNSNS